MKKLLFNLSMALLCLFSNTLNAQQFRGKVIDAIARTPLSGVNITAKDTKEGTSTNENGEFEITTEQAVTFSFVGYKSQTIQPVDGFIVVLLEQDSRQLSDVVVSAFNAKRSLATVSAPVAVISKKDLQRADNNSVIPVFSTIPGVKLDYYTVGDYRLNIRGGALAQPSVHSSGYKIYWNGIPISSGTLGGLDVNFIDQIEVIKGPGSSLYGAGFGGTVLINTDRASKFGTSVNTDFMLGDYSTSRSTTGIKHNGRWGNFAIQYTTSKTDGFRDMTDSKGDVLNLYGQVYTGEKGTLNLLYNYENRSMGIAGDLDEQTFNTAPETANTTEPTSFGPMRHTVGLGYDYDFDKKWNASFGLYYNKNEVDFLLTFPFFGIYDDESSNAVTSRASVTYKSNWRAVGFKLDAGLEYGNAESKVINYDADYTSTSANIFNVSEAKTDNILTFGQVEFMFPENLYLNFGLSYNSFRYEVGSAVETNSPITFDTSVDHVAPRVALLKKWGNHSVFASLGQGFTPPNGGIFNDFLNSDGSVSNLKPATGWNKEIGARGSLNELLFYDLTAYQLNIKDAIISQLFEISSGVNEERKTNAGEVHQRGVEALLGLNLTKDPNNFWYNSQLRLGYTFNNFEYEDYQTVRTETADDFSTVLVPVDYSGKNIPGTIPHSWLIMADIYTKLGVYLHISLNTYDDTFLTNDNNEKEPSYSLINTKLGYLFSVVEDRLEIDLYAGANNLGDTLYSGLTAYNSTFGAFYNPAFKRQYFGGIRLTYQF